MRFKSSATIFLVGLAHAALVLFLLLVGWLGAKLVFAFFALLALDFPLSLIFNSIAGKLFPPERFPGWQDPYAMSNLALGVFHFVLGSLWYCLLMYWIRNLWRSNNFITAALRDLWHRNIR